MLFVFFCAVIWLWSSYKVMIHITSFEVITFVLMSFQDTLKEWIHLLPIPQVQDSPPIFVQLIL